MWCSVCGWGFGSVVNAARVFARNEIQPLPCPLVAAIKDFVGEIWWFSEASAIAAAAWPSCRAIGLDTGRTHLVVLRCFKKFTQRANALTGLINLFLDLVLALCKHGHLLYTVFIYSI